MFLRQSTIQTIRFGPFLDATDGVTEEVSLTITQALRRISKDGAAFAQSGTTGNATHDSDGWYSADLSAADTGTVGELILNVQVPATHLPVWQRYWVIEEAVYDAHYGAAAAGPLQSTVAARTLDVTAAGEAALDLDNTSGTLAAAQIASAAFTAAKFGADFITAASIADNSITSDQLATDAIGNLQLATDCIGAAEFSNFAAGKVADSVWDEPKAGHTNVSNFGDLATDLDSVLADTADMQPKLGTPAADVSADIAAVKVDTAATLVDTATTIPGTITTLQADTDDIQTRLPASLVGGAMDSDVSAMQAGTVTAAAIATDAIDADALAADAVVEIIGQVSGTADSGTTTTLVDAARTEADTDYWKGSVLLITSGTAAGQVRRITAFDAGTDTMTVDTAFTQAISTNTYTILKTTYVEAPAAGSGDWSTAEKEQFRSALGLDGTKTAATGGQLQTIDGVVDTILVDTADMQPKLGSPAADLSADIAAVKVDTAATLVDTADMQPKLGTPAADLSADIAAVKVDTAATLVDTGTTIPGTITTLQADTDDIQTRLPASLVGGAMDADVSAVQANAIDAAALAADVTTELRSLVSGTADSGTTTTMVDAARTEADTDYFKGAWILFTSGTITGQVRQITGFTPASDTVTFSPATTQAVATNTYEILPAAAAADLVADVAAVKADTVAILVDTADMQPKLGSPAADVSADIAAVKVDTAATLVDTADMQPKLGTPAADLAADVAAVKVDTAATLVDTGTTIPGTITTLQADTDDIQTRLPASLVGGAMDSDVSAMQAGTVTAAAIATDAVDADALATSAVDEIKDVILPVINTAYSDIPVMMVDDTDHFTPKTGLSLGVTRSIDGGAFGAGTGTAAEISNGLYQYDASSADMNGTLITFRFTGTAADDTFVVLRTGG